MPEALAELHLQPGWNQFPERPGLWVPSRNRDHPGWTLALGQMECLTSVSDAFYDLLGWSDVEFES